VTQEESLKSDFYKFKVTAVEHVQNEEPIPALPMLNTSTIPAASKPANTEAITTPATSEHNQGESLSPNMKDGKVQSVKQENCYVNFTHFHSNFPYLLTYLQSQDDTSTSQHRKRSDSKDELSTSDSKKRLAFTSYMIIKKQFLLITHITPINHEQACGQTVVHRYQ
jgi:hypothetical protein